MTQLSGQGRAILGELVKHIKTRTVIPGDPETYTFYKTVHDALGLDKRGLKYGESLKVQGLKNLADWCHANGLPAITGLIVAMEDHSPGEGYYEAFGKPLDSIRWWDAEIAKSVAYDWSEFVPEEPEEEPEPEAPPATPVASDVDEPPPRVSFTAYRILRDTEVARRVKQLHEYRCQICGETITLPDGSRYAEAHHIRPLGKDGPDTTTNVMCVCPNHHAELDYGVRRIDISSLRKHPSHSIERRHVEFHNLEIFQSPPEVDRQA